jgi:putative selenate reductase
VRELHPVPFRDHLRRLKKEVGEGKLFDLPAKAFWVPREGIDLSVEFHGIPAATPAGPAAGPQSQMAQNILLSYLAGGRVMELKTVQIMDRLSIPRPCIDSRTIGFNIEWSQELLIEESLHEYVAGAWLVNIARGENWIRADKPLTPETDPVIYDISVGYDLRGIRSRRVVNFLREMMDATAWIERLEREIRDEFPEYLKYRPQPHLAGTATLSTFHGCPPEEIEGICTFLLEEIGLHTVVKMNPTMLGRERVEQLLREKMGYSHLRTNPRAYEVGLQFDESLDLIRGLRARGDQVGLGLNVKFSNTLEVLNDEGPFTETGEKIRYLSGQPLHVITTVLMDKWRRAVGWDRPMSYSAGIDRKNFGHIARCGCVPITTCTDLLRPGGYARLADQLRDWEKRLAKEGKASLREDVGPPEQWAKYLEDYAAGLPEDERYWHAKNERLPRKIDSELTFYDCINCDKCIPVCPNDAMFAYETSSGKREVHVVRFDPASGFEVSPGDALEVKEDHQLANFADWCNECGNCDTHCPEHDGPFVMKPRLFGDRFTYMDAAPQEGFLAEMHDGLPTITGRLGDREYVLQLDREANRAFLRDEFLLIEIDLETHQVVEMHLSQVLGAARSVSTEVYHRMRDVLVGIYLAEQANPVNAGR